MKILVVEDKDSLRDGLVELLKGAGQSVEVAGKRLTAREVGVVRWLYRHHGWTVSRAELLEHIWHARPDMETRTVDMTIAHLRQKIERDPGKPAIIVSVKGVGYSWGQP